MSNQTLLTVKKGDNLRGKTLKITLYGTSQDGNKLFAFALNKVDVIRALEQDLDLDHDILGFKGYGIFAECFDNNDNQKIGTAVTLEYLGAFKGINGYAGKIDYEEGDTSVINYNKTQGVIVTRSVNTDTYLTMLFNVKKGGLIRM